MMYIHNNNETVKRINVSKIANTSTLGDNGQLRWPYICFDNSTAAGCNSRLITVLVLVLVNAMHSYPIHAHVRITFEKHREYEDSF